MPSARISLTLSRNASLSSFASGRSSGITPVSAKSCCCRFEQVVLHLLFAQPCEGVHKSTSLMSLSLLLQLCPAFSWWVVSGHITSLCGVLPPGLVQYFSQHSCVVTAIFFSICLVSVHVMHPYSSINTTAAWKKLRFILSVRSDFHMTDSQPKAVHAFASHVLMSVSVDETLLRGRWTCQLVSESYRLVWRYHLLLKHIYSILYVLTWKPMHQRFVPDYVARLWLGRVYLPVALCHQRSRRR